MGHPSFVAGRIPEILCGLKEPRESRQKEPKQVHYASPDFLLILAALANFMRLSLRRAAYADLVGFVK
jgi:hypothetical protein